MSNDVEQRIRTEFIAEASEMLEAVEASFMELERNPSDGRVIDKIFRLAHTIKGSALTCGFTGLGEFAHVVETLLVRIREKKIAMSSDVVDLLLVANDRLAAFVAALGEDMGGSVETRDVTSRIHAVMDAGDGAAPSAPSTPPAARAAPEGWGLFDDEPAPAPAGAAATAAPGAAASEAGPMDAQPLVPLASTLAATALTAYLGLVRLSLIGTDDDAIDLGPALARAESTVTAALELRSALRRAS